MNTKIKIFIFIVILLLFLYLIRTIIYNNYINNLNKVKESFVSKDTTLKKAIDLNTLNINTPNNLLNIVSNPTLIYSTIMGEIIIISNNEVIIIVNKKIKGLELKDFFGENYNLNNHREYFSGGFFNYKNNTLNIFQGDNIVIYSLSDKKVLLTDKKIISK